MIIWINGAFGSGKTTCAFELKKRIGNAFVYDPENIGFCLQSNLPEKIRKPDFQNLKQWRLFNYEVLKYMYQEYGGSIIVPMTIANKQYFNEIIGQLINDGIQIKHFILYANKQTIIKRLNRRLEYGESWAKTQIDRCIYAFDNDICDEKILTDNLSIDAIVGTIAERCELSLKPDNRGRLQKWIDRCAVSIQHIRK